MRILFISANPHWEARLDLAEELRLLMRAIKGLDVELMLLPAAQPAEVAAALEYERPDIVHFSGHATEQDGILLRNAEGETEELPPEKLRELLTSDDGGHIELVVLNACNTRRCVEQLRDAVGAVIGTTAPLADGAGKAFTKHFYRALAKHATITDAYKKATGSIRLAKLNDVYTEGFATAESAAVKPFDGVEESDSDHVSPEVLRSWETYFYLSFLDEQIESLKRWIHKNRIELRWLVVVAAVLAGVLIWRAAGSGNFGETTAYLLGLFNNGDESLLTWLITGGGGAAIQGIYAFLQQRSVAHGNERLESLKSLRNLVNTADELTSDVRETLHHLLDQSLRGAQLQ